jgi:predicted DNA-binding protein (MmcQ/YjbR family)
VTERQDVPPEIVAKLRSVCGALPEAYEEDAWVGVRWRIRGRTFAHVLHIDAGWPPAYARAAETEGPADVLMFRSSGEELNALRHAGDPFFAPPWRDDEVVVVLDGRVDWDEVSELVTDSYCLLAPKKLSDAVARPRD